MIPGQYCYQTRFRSPYYCISYPRSRWLSRSLLDVLWLLVCIPLKSAYAVTSIIVVFALLIIL